MLSLEKLSCSEYYSIDDLTDKMLFDWSVKLANGWIATQIDTRKGIRNKFVKEKGTYIN